MAGSKFQRLNAKTNSQEVEQPDEQSDQQTNKPTNQQTTETINRQVVVRGFAPTFASLPEGSGVHLTIEDLRPTLLEVGKEQRSFSIHHLEKMALDRATFLLKMQGLKADANKLARLLIVKGLAELDEKGIDSFAYKMLENLSN